MSIFKSFATNASKESEGIDHKIDADPNKDGSIPTFHIVRMGPKNRKFTRTWAELTKPYARKMQAGTLDADTSQRISILVFVRSGITGWSNVFDQNEEPIPFNEENAVKLFTHLFDLFQELQTVALSMESFQDEDDEIIAKN